MRTITAALLLMLLPSIALGHGSESSASTAANWTWDPWIVAPLFVTGMLYAVGACFLRRRVAIGRNVRAWHNLASASGWLTLAGALVSPLHWLGERLFTVHMIEHEIVMAVSAPLLVMARPIGTMLWSLPHDLRVATGRWLRQRPIVNAWHWLSAGGTATTIHAIAIWAWHAPSLFDAAVANVTLHRLQHLSFLLSALLFWWSVLRRSNNGVAAWHLFLTMLHTSILGALMALAPRVLYSAQTTMAPAWGLTPLEDQQLAGLIMWVPASTVYSGAALAMVTIWIRRSDKTQGRYDASRLL